MVSFGEKYHVNLYQCIAWDSILVLWEHEVKVFTKDA